jgi:Rrf2 family protein
MAGIINVSEAASIAFHTAFKLAAGGGALVRKEDLAGELEVSGDHLAKVIQRMARAGIVETLRGPKGGCRLTQAAAGMTLLEIYEAVEGPYRPLKCLLKRPLCDGNCCLLGGVLQRMSGELYEQLKNTTLRDVADKLSAAPARHGPAGASPSR